MNRLSKFHSTRLFLFGFIATLGTLMGASSPAKPLSFACAVELVYEFRAQDGTLVRTESYIKNFIITPDAGFYEDYSTPTRIKEFAADVEQIGREIIVNISWFSDVSTFDSIDLNTSLAMTAGQLRGRHSGSQRFSNSAGHSIVRYNLVAVRN